MSATIHEIFKNYGSGALIGFCYGLIRVLLGPKKICSMCGSKLPKFWLMEIMRLKYYGEDACPKCHSRISGSARF
jgi:DNA-directed RNA polymerase subunit RPC12/RpoP